MVPRLGGVAPYWPPNIGGVKQTPIEGVYHAAAQAAVNDGFTLSRNKSNYTAAAPPMMYKMVSIEVVVRRGHVASRGCFSGAVARTRGVQTPHASALKLHVGANADRIHQVRMDAIHGKCDLQIFVDDHNPEQINVRV